MEDLRRIPLTARDAIQFAAPEEVLAAGTDPATLITRRTSGSSGRPLAIRRTRAEQTRIEAHQWEMYRLLGNRPWERRAAIELIRGPSRRTPSYRRLGLYSMAHMDVRLPAREMLDRLRRIRPDVLIGPSAAIGWLAGELTVADRREIHPRLIVTWGETIPDETRQRIKAEFRARVFDYYVSHELGIIATECEATSGYHIHDQSVIVEVLKDGLPVQEGKEGELVGTALHSYAMPFLRYRQADWVVAGPSPCPCGAPFSTISKIQGRVLDRIALPDGTMVHPYTVILPVVAEWDWIRRYQFVQETSDLIRLRVVPYGTRTNDDAVSLGAAMASRLGMGLRLEVELVEEIPPSPTGKFYPFVSLDRQRAWQRDNPRA